MSSTTTSYRRRSFKIDGLSHGLRLVAFVTEAGFIADLTRQARTAVARERASGGVQVKLGRLEAVAESAPAMLAGLAVLVVDDERAENAPCRSRRARRKVRTANGGTQALDHLAHWTPDVIVSDIGMPERMGTRLSGASGPCPAMGAVACRPWRLTASVKPEDRMQALAAGFHTHVPKPVDPDGLALIVARLAGLSRPTSP